MKHKGPSIGRREPLSDSNLLFLIAAGIFVFLYAIAMIFLSGKGYLSPEKFLDLFNNNASLIILTCGLSIVMVGGGIDISVGGVTALTTMVCTVYLESAGGGAGNVWWSLGIALCVGLAFGLVQGFLIAYLDIQPFIITLAGMIFARGLATILDSSNLKVTNAAFLKFMSSKPETGAASLDQFLGKFFSLVSVGTLIAIVVVAAVAVMLKWTRFGRNLYAVGGNKQSALTLGINVRFTKFMSYLICGFLGGIAGFVYLMKVVTGYYLHANAFEMKAIAASIIGGTMLTGGVGNIIGSVFGVLTLVIIESLVVQSGLSVGRSYLQTISTGAMLCLFILMQSVVLSKRKK